MRTVTDTNLLKEYKDFCRSKCKKFDDDLYTTPEAYHIMHMDAGVYSELGEVVDLLKKWLSAGKKPDAEKLMEEWGDHLFYLIQLRVNPDAPIESGLITAGQDWANCIIPSKGYDNNPYTILYHIRGYRVELNDMIDAVASSVGLSAERRKILEERYDDLLYVVMGQWFVIGDMLKIDTNKAMEYNMLKLSKRYAAGFTPQEAIVRRDKGEE